MATYEEICNAISIFQGKLAPPWFNYFYALCISVSCKKDFRLSNNINHLAQLSGLLLVIQSYARIYRRFDRYSIRYIIHRKAFTIDNGLEGAIML